MGVGKCKACDNSDVTISLFGQGALILCHSCGLKVKGTSLEDVERKWRVLEIVAVGADERADLIGKHILTTATLLSPMALFGSPVMENPLARLMRKKEPKQMGPGSGTSRQRRAKDGKPW